MNFFFLSIDLLLSLSGLKIFFRLLVVNVGLLCNRDLDLVHCEELGEKSDVAPMAALDGVDRSSKLSLLAMLRFRLAFLSFLFLLVFLDSVKFGVGESLKSPFFRFGVARAFMLVGEIVEAVEAKLGRRSLAIAFLMTPIVFFIS